MSPDGNHRLVLKEGSELAFKFAWTERAGLWATSGLSVSREGSNTRTSTSNATRTEGRSRYMLQLLQYGSLSVVAGPRCP